ncbi:hypothetical protein NL676_031268 [Syzygium grande]|nr:hypothetical protein NL676_031268 [Syzygium grande]
MSPSPTSLASSVVEKPQPQTPAQESTGLYLLTRNLELGDKLNLEHRHPKSTVFREVVGEPTRHVASVRIDVHRQSNRTPGVTMKACRFAPRQTVYPIVTKNASSINAAKHILQSRGDLTARAVFLALRHNSIARAVVLAPTPAASSGRVETGPLWLPWLGAWSSSAGGSSGGFTGKP